MKERERVQERLRQRGERDRSRRQRDHEHETDNERRVRQRQESSTQLAGHADRERKAKQDRSLLFWQQEFMWQVSQPRHALCINLRRKSHGWDEAWWIAIDDWLDDHEPDGTEQWWSKFATYARSAQTKKQSLFDAIAHINGRSSVEPLRRCKAAAKAIPDVRDGDPIAEAHAEAAAEAEKERLEDEFAAQLRGFAELYATDATQSHKLAACMEVTDYWGIEERRAGPNGFQYKVSWSDSECNEWAHVWAPREHLPIACLNIVQRIDVKARAYKYLPSFGNS